MAMMTIHVGKQRGNRKFSKGRGKGRKVWEAGSSPGKAQGERAAEWSADRVEKRRRRWPRSAWGGKGRISYLSG